MSLSSNEARELRKVKMINKKIPKSISYALKHLSFLENKKLYEISEEIIKHYIDKHKDVLEKEEVEPLVNFSVRIDKELADKFGIISKKTGIRQDKLLEQAVNEYIKDKKIKL